LSIPNLAKIFFCCPIIINEIDGRKKAKSPQPKVSLFCLLAIFTTQTVMKIRRINAPIEDIALN
jgi:hypothetical protein